jgi:hypothetical protein
LQRWLDDVLPLTVGIATEEESAGLHVRLFDKNDLSALCRSMSVNAGQCRSMPVNAGLGRLRCWAQAALTGARQPVPSL